MISDGLSKALAQAQAELRNPVCDRSNSHFQARYATLTAILDAVRPVFNRHGLTVLQPISGKDGLLTVATIIIHSGGGSFSSEISVPLDSNIQRVGAAITYLRRYSLASLVGIVGDEDDDAESIVASTREKGKQRAKETEKPTRRETAKVAGADEVTPVAVEFKEGKNGKKGYYRVGFSSAAGEAFSATTFSETIANRLTASVGQPTQVFFERKEANGREWLNITEVI